jgi:hypothetical protein
LSCLLNPPTSLPFFLLLGFAFCISFHSISMYFIIKKLITVLSPYFFFPNQKYLPRITTQILKIIEIQLICSSFPTNVLPHALIGYQYQDQEI